MLLSRTKPAWLLLFGVLLLCAMPVAVFGVFQLLLSSNMSSTALNGLMTVCLAAFMLSGLALIVAGASRVHFSSKMLAALIVLVQLLQVSHYVAWKNGVFADPGGAAATWLVLLLPLLVFGLVTLIRSIMRRERMAWIAAALTLWLAQVATTCYLYWIVGGV